MTAATWQCVGCLKYLKQDRTEDASYCDVCVPGGLERTQTATLDDKHSLEIVALIAEECGEVTQRVGKIIRWGHGADFQGTSQQQKLESELGDILAAISIGAHNGEVRWEAVLDAANEKLAKFREDAAGPRQRLLHAAVPRDGIRVILARYVRDFIAR